MDEYDGRQFVGIDLHRRRSVIVRMTESGEQSGTVRIVNDPVALALELSAGRPGPRGGAGSHATAGTGRSTCWPRGRRERCIWRIRWGSRVSRTGG